MTLLTVDAKVMPILPLIARPSSTDALVVAFGMGSSFRSALIAGLRTDVVELVPSVPKMFGYYYPDAAAVLANPNGHVIIADGRNHLELTNKHYDIIVTDPPPPIESSGASVISSREYYQAGYDHLTPGGIMMEWIPYGQSIEEWNAHVRAFTAVFPRVTIVFGPGGYGMYMLGSVDPIAFDRRLDQGGSGASGRARGDLERVRQPRAHDRWLDEPHRREHLAVRQGTDRLGGGRRPMVTDDRPGVRVLPDPRVGRVLDLAGRRPFDPARGCGSEGGRLTVSDVAGGVNRPRLLARIGLVAGALVFALYLGLWAAWISGGSEGADYTAFYTGWSIVAQGDGASLYDPAFQAQVQKEILGGRTFDAGLNPFNNPPHIVLPFVPLTVLPLAASYAAWAVVQVVLLGWLLWRLVTRVASDWTREERTLLIAASIAAPPLALALLQGSFSLLVTVALLEVFLALRAGGERAAAAWLVVASVKPQAVLTTGVALLAARRWRVLGFAAAGMIVLVVAASAVMGVGIWPSYLRFLGDYIGSFDVFSVRPSVMWNLRGTLSLWSGL